MDRYIASKVAHLKRAGLVSGQKTGLGMNGGAAPDWLVSEQEDRARKAEKDRYRQYRQSIAVHGEPTA